MQQLKQDLLYKPEHTVSCGTRVIMSTDESNEICKHIIKFEERNPSYNRLLANRTRIQNKDVILYTILSPNYDSFTYVNGGIYLEIDELELRVNQLKNFINELQRKTRIIRLRAKDNSITSPTLTRLLSSIKALSKPSFDEYIALKRLLEIKKRVRWAEKNKPEERLYSILIKVKKGKRVI